MNRVSTRRWQDQCATAGANTPAMTTATAFTRSMSKAAERFWSLLRSWLRPHRGISQEKPPLYLGFFQFVHNVRIRGKGLLKPLLQLLVA